MYGGALSARYVSRCPPDTIYVNDNWKEITRWLGDPSPRVTMFSSGPLCQTFSLIDKKPSERPFEIWNETHTRKRYRESLRQRTLKEANKWETVSYWPLQKRSKTNSSGCWTCCWCVFWMFSTAQQKVMRDYTTYEIHTACSRYDGALRCVMFPWRAALDVHWSVHCNRLRMEDRCLLAEVQSRAEDIKTKFRRFTLSKPFCWRATELRAHSGLQKVLPEQGASLPHHRTQEQHWVGQPVTMQILITQLDNIKDDKSICILLDKSPNETCFWLDIHYTISYWRHVGFMALIIYWVSKNWKKKYKTWNILRGNFSKLFAIITPVNCKARLAQFTIMCNTQIFGQYRIAGHSDYQARHSPENVCDLLWVPIHII